MHLLAALYTTGAKLELASGCAGSVWVGGIGCPPTGFLRLGSGRTDLGAGSDSAFPVSECWAALLAAMCSATRLSKAAASGDWGRL